MAISPTSFENEQVLQIPLPGKDECFVASGYANFFSGTAPGDGHPLNCKITGGGSNSDEKWFGTEVHMTVGPKWVSVSQVAPLVSIAGISFRDSDTTDHTGCKVSSCDWDMVEAADNKSIKFKRIRLKVWITMCGGQQSAVIKLSYYLTAIGRQPVILQKIPIPL